MCHSDAGPVDVDGLKDAIVTSEHIVTDEQDDTIVGGTIQGESSRPINCLAGKKKKKKRREIVFTLLWRLDGGNLLRFIGIPKD